MIYLLGQILLCLLLAVIAGWFVGWSWRGFRDADQVEDLRRTLRATEEVKDRELAEAQRRADGLDSRVEILERRCERLAQQLTEARGEGAPAVHRSEALAETDADVLATAAIVPVDEVVPAGEPLPIAAAEAAPDENPFAGSDPEAGSTEVADARLESAEEALREKAAAVLELQAEIASLREGARERAADLARLERRVVELEPLETQLTARQKEVVQLRGELEETRERTSGGDDRLRELDEQTRQLETAVLERDRRINELRQRYQDTAARLEVAEADQQALRKRLSQAVTESAEEDSEELSRCRDRLAAVEREVEEARSTLQRQIERNRKQETVHQQVVANLRSELRDAREAPAPAPAIDPERDGRVRQLIADRDSRIHALLRRVEEVEAELGRRPPPRDDLKRIRGIGPKIERLLNDNGITAYAQIAAWTEEDIDRMSDELGAFRERIKWDDWPEGARRQHILEYGHPPESGQRDRDDG